MHSPIDLVKLVIFDGLSFEVSYIFQDGKALQLPLMVMSGPHILEKIHGQFQTRFYAFESHGI